MPTKNVRLGLATLPLLALLAAGCGGGGSSSPGRDSTLRMSVVWPTRTARFIPNASNSVVAVVSVKGKEIARSLIVRPSTGGTASATLDLKAAAGDATVAMTAYPDADGSGIAQASATKTVRLIKGGTTTFDASLMASTVARLALAPDPGRGGVAAAAALQVYATETAGLAVAAYDAQDRIVLLEKGAFAEDMAWTSNASGTAAVSADGAVTGVAAGAANVTLTLNAGGAAPVAATFPVTVVAARTLVSIATTPTGFVDVTTYNDIQLRNIATYSDGSTKDVTNLTQWSVYMAGTISSTGLFVWDQSSGYSTANFGASYGGQYAAFAIRYVR